MRFRLRDLLLLTVLVAVYLTAFKIAFGGTNRDHLFEASIGTFIGSVLFVVLVLIAIWFNVRRALRKQQPILAAISLPSPWTAFFAWESFVLAVSFLTKVHELFTSAFIGASAGFFISVLTRFLMPSVKITRQGIMNHAGLQTWQNVYPLRAADGKLMKVRLQNPSFGPKVTIPEELREQIEELMRNEKPIAQSGK